MPSIAVSWRPTGSGDRSGSDHAGVCELSRLAVAVPGRVGSRVRGELVGALGVHVRVRGADGGAEQRCCEDAETDGGSGDPGGYLVHGDSQSSIAARRPG